MRVTNSNYSDTLAGHLQRINQRQVSLQGQVSTGQRVQSPEDDPLAAGQILKLNENSAAAKQYQKNIENHSEFATVSLSAMRSLSTILNRAQEIAFKADGLESRGDLRSYAVEVGQMIKQAVQVANVTHRGEYILGGTQITKPPFKAELDGEGQVANVTFEGNSELSESEIARGVRITSRVAGENNSGNGERGLVSDSRYGADLFGHLIALQKALVIGDTQAIATVIRGNLQNDEENVVYHMGDNASLQSRLEATLGASKDESLSLSSEISRRADVDLAETLVRLNQNQTNYQAALQSAGSVLNLSLMDYLR